MKICSPALLSLLLTTLLPIPGQACEVTQTDSPFNQATVTLLTDCTTRQIEQVFAPGSTGARLSFSHSGVADTAHINLMKDHRVAFSLIHLNTSQISNMAQHPAFAGGESDLGLFVLLHELAHQYDDADWPYASRPTPSADYGNQQLLGWYMQRLQMEAVADMLALYAYSDRKGVDAALVLSSELQRYREQRHGGPFMFTHDTALFVRFAAQRLQSHQPLTLIQARAIAEKAFTLDYRQACHSEQFLPLTAMTEVCRSRDYQAAAEILRQAMNE